MINEDTFVPIFYVMKRVLIAALLAVVSAVAAFADTALWVPDTAGLPGVWMHRVDQGRDYSGPVRCTVLRMPCTHSDGKGVLYIHGYNDYFFQHELAAEFVDHGYDFYAVDLRKYGRSLLPGQQPYLTRSMDEYFADIDSALAIMRHQGVRHIVLMGHSTGGLLTAYYMMQMEKHHPAQIADVDAVVLNSPFLDWNEGFLENILPGVAAFGKLIPSIPIKMKGDSYGSSLLKSRHGEWSFNTSWKNPDSSAVNLGWIRAIDRAQRKLRSQSLPIKVPVLLFFSDHSVKASSWDPECQAGDAVLDVKDIRELGSRLGKHVKPVVVPDALHDVMLSRSGVRNAVYSYMFKWLNDNIP